MMNGDKVGMEADNEGGTKGSKEKEKKTVMDEKW